MVLIDLTSRDLAELLPGKQTGQDVRRQGKNGKQCTQDVKPNPTGAKKCPIIGRVFNRPLIPLHEGALVPLSSR